MARAPRNRPHLLLEGGGVAEPFTSPRLVITGLPPVRARAAHAAKLEQALGAAVAQARRTMAARDEAIAEGERGFYLEFDLPASERGFADALESKRGAIELFAVRPPKEGEQTVHATVFVPERSSDAFSTKIEAYRTQDTPSGKPRNDRLVSAPNDEDP